MQQLYKHVFSGILLVALCILALGCSCDIGKSGPDKVGAFVMSKEFVIKRLKAPSTADFPWYDESFVTDLGGGEFRVSAYVDAQNSFGAKIRSNYTCVLKSTDGNNWTLESINNN